MVAALRALAPAQTGERLVAVCVAAALGIGLIFASGFSPAVALHNAAHDWRHANNFPCH
ncbi:cobalt transporter, subunit CbtB [Methylobacterium sp. 4-46]|uniref:CbtB domain-containing protein n=1 Tax=unclassified Methylobacterium TaxID=2615210 RepID=UPI000152C204|nr:MULTISPECIES: CbtB domain-containing protein [Methylobacterium]ACA16889.1 cobalt transporter, subunit CbtB [Methylobacterium sp. 4-46]WFT82578.1 CbtB-domain containing protein [Methylobacterium nodulans]